MRMTIVHFEDKTIKLGLGVAETHPQHILWVLCNPSGNDFTYLYFAFKQPDFIAIFKPWA